jgi:cytochrome P450
VDHTDHPVRRTVPRDTELDGQQISAGDKVVLYYISANRDDTVFTDPDHFNLQRTPNLRLAFGVGPHFCLGAPLRRLRRTGSTIRLESNFMNGIKTLPIASGSRA